MSDEVTWVDGPHGKIPYNIQTEAGRKIWTEINLKGGSTYWGPLGRALPEVEAEAMKVAEERIIALLEAELADFYNTGDDWHEGYSCALSTAIALIKGENE